MTDADFTEDERVLNAWREGLILQDHRLESKALFKLAGQAMSDEQLRTRLVNDTQAVLSELKTELDLLEGVTLRFHENTQYTLNVVLPPRVGEIRTGSETLREALRSRTSAAAFCLDDLNVGNFKDNFNLGANSGDRHTHDHQPVVTE